MSRRLVTDAELDAIAARLAEARAARAARAEARAERDRQYRELIARQAERPGNAHAIGLRRMGLDRWRS